MSNSTTTLDLISTSQSTKEVTANGLFDAASPAMLYGRRASTSAGLTFGYYGGTITVAGTPTPVANGTLTLTASATNYVEANPATGAVTVNTSAFTAGKTPLYQIVVGATTVTSYTDLRTLGDSAGAAAGLLEAHETASDPHPGYLTQAEGDARYASVSGAVSDGDKGDIVVSASGATWGIDTAVLSTFGRTLTDDANAAAARTTLGLGTSATLDVDTDATMAANSASKVPAQSAVVAYVATQLDGRSWKQRVRAATTANGTLATAFANGQTIDGVTLATGDRILLKNQSTGSENGIYVVAASGAPARSSDADTGSELVNATVEVSEGTANADLQYTCSTNSPITVGSTALVFVGTSTSTSYTADETSLHLSGSQFAIKANSQPFDLTAFYPGVPTASSKITRVPVARAITFPANFSGSYAKAATAATASTAIDVQNNGTSIGTITFAAAGSVATFTTVSGTSKTLAAGDILSIIAPATADATLADIGLVLAGVR